jgi:arginine decarboxylase
MSTAVTTEKIRVDQFFTATEARLDRWRKLVDVTRSWQAGAEKDGSRAIELVSELEQWEDFFAYPGPSLLRTLKARMSSGDATGTARLAQSINLALLTHSYRNNANDWDSLVSQ